MRYDIMSYGIVVSNDRGPASIKFKTLSASRLLNTLYIEFGFILNNCKCPALFRSKSYFL